MRAIRGVENPFMARLFVYGSLQRGCSNAGLLEGAACLGPGSTADGHALVLYHDGFPALYRDQSGRGRVRGELYVVGSALLIELDAFEDVPDLYQREEIELADGSTAQAYIVTAEVASQFVAVQGGSWRD